MPEQSPTVSTLVDIRRAEPANLVRAHGLDLALLHPWPGLATPFRGAWCVLRPGDRTDVHQHRERELFVAMSGRGEVLLDGERHELAAGDLMLLPADHDHHVHNPFDEDFAYYAIWWDRVLAEDYLAEVPA
ncbi:cupin domain-containing protein [Actinokineospora enzanensis]|uniref:cupin domain-containing protein n=1 Tax=Actinokineospora enzanensis TaxID=155975 RepID=UPI000367377E|nr:cupin domain-containing protein [Actinokineospora enzanensis]